MNSIFFFDLEKQVLFTNFLLIFKNQVILFNYIDLVGFKTQDFIILYFNQVFISINFIVLKPFIKFDYIIEIKKVLY